MRTWLMVMRLRTMMESSVIGKRPCQARCQVRAISHAWQPVLPPIAAAVLKGGDGPVLRLLQDLEPAADSHRQR
jgi:hypothetical protein